MDDGAGADIGHHGMVLRRDDAGAGMSESHVLEVLTAFGEAGCRFWVAGGWGVDALIGHQTRPHQDLDLAIDAQDEPAALDVLNGLGYRVETDWRPVRVELARPDHARVDLHPVHFDKGGHGRQADLDGGHFDYPPEAFATGLLGGVVTPCLSRAQQVRFHRGYEPRPRDLHDLAILESLALTPP